MTLPTSCAVHSKPGVAVVLDISMIRLPGIDFQFRYNLRTMRFLCLCIWLNYTQQWYLLLSFGSLFYGGAGWGSSEGQGGRSSRATRGSSGGRDWRERIRSCQGDGRMVIQSCIKESHDEHRGSWSAWCSVVICAVEIKIEATVYGPL